MAKIDFSSYTDLRFEPDERILNVIFNRPDKKNPVSGKMSTELIRLMRELDSDNEFRVVVITGAGTAFSAGGDLAVMKSTLDRPESFLEVIGEVRDLVHALIDCPKPVIAKVNGPAIGLGATVALYCDMIFAAEDARIADPHIALGLVPGDGGAIIWPHLIGLPRAKQYLLTGDPLSGTEAAQIGLINRAVPRADLDKVVREFAQHLAEGPPRVMQLTKISLNVALKREVSALLDTSFAWEVVSAFSKDHKEAVTAWLDKRKPKFTGE
jgi:enoyl-CoA hydratase